MRQRIFPRHAVVYHVTGVDDGVDALDGVGAMLGADLRHVPVDISTLDSFRG